MNAALAALLFCCLAFASGYVQVGLGSHDIGSQWWYPLSHTYGSGYTPYHGMGYRSLLSSPLTHHVYGSGYSPMGGIDHHNWWSPLTHHVYGSGYYPYHSSFWGHYGLDYPYYHKYGYGFPHIGMSSYGYGHNYPMVY